LSAVNPSLEHEIVARVRAELPETAVLFITRRAGPTELAIRVLALDPPVKTSLDAEPDPPPAARQAGFDGTLVGDDIERRTLSGTTDADLEVLASSGALDGVDPIDALLSIDEVSQAIEASEAAAVPDTSPATSDAKLDSIVASLKLTREDVDVPDGELGGDEPPFFWKVMRPFRRTALAAVLAVTVFTIARLTPDVIFGVVANVVNQGGTSDTDTSDKLALLVLVMGLVGGAASYAFRVQANRFSQGLITYLRRRAFFRLVSLGVDYYDRELPGQVAARVVYDLDRILQFLQQTGFLLLSSVAVFVLGMLLIVVLAPAAFPLILAMVVVVVIIALVQLPIANQAWRWARRELGVVTAKFEEDFVARHEIRNLGAAEIQTRKFVDACWRRLRAKWYALTVQAVGTQLVTFIALMLQTLVLWKTGTLAIEGTLTIGIALTVYLLVLTATQPLRQAGQLYSALLEVRVSWARLREPFQEPILPVVSPDAAPCPDLRGDVTFDHVAFHYPHAPRPVLRDVSFSIPAGTVTALVGYTGAGKSSIAKLLSRTYDPTSGSVTVDGIDLRAMQLETYVPHLGVVPQDAFVFRGTVASNIAYAVPDAPREDIERAARDVGAYDLLSTLPGGLDHPVDEEGRNLTAGQRQLIALARAWMMRPDVLVLDEATSLLDADVEQKVLDGVHALGCTTLMITHRENVAESADTVVVLDAGRVVDSGTVEAVARPGSPYDRLWHLLHDEALVESPSADVDAAPS
jgi:ATP-binding cassette subfamily B protein